MEIDSSPTSTAEFAASLDESDPHLKRDSLKYASPKPKSMASSFLSMIRGGEKKVVKQLSFHDSFRITDKDVEDTLADTVYISPTWLCNVLKGVIRHDRDCLLRYFINCNDQIMIRRVKRLLICGRMHSSLAGNYSPYDIR